MKVELFASYGVLSHEKEPVFSLVLPASDIYDRVTVDLPDELVVGTNYEGEPLLKLSGMTYRLSEALDNQGHSPVIQWHDGRQYYSRKLMIVQ